MHKKGFTLVEVLLVVAILSFISSIVTVAFSNARTRANDAATLADTKNLNLAAQSYRSDNGTYPPMPDPAGQIVTSNETSSDDHRWTDLWGETGTFGTNPPVSRDPNHPYAYALYEDPVTSEQIGVLFSYQQDADPNDPNRCYPFGLPPAQTLRDITQKIADATSNVIKTAQAQSSTLSVSCSATPAQANVGDTIVWNAVGAGNSGVTTQHFSMSGDSSTALNSLEFDFNTKIGVPLTATNVQQDDLTVLVGVNENVTVTPGTIEETDEGPGYGSDGHYYDDNYVDTYNPWTITLPDDAILFNNTTGYWGLGDYPGRANVTIRNVSGSNSYTIQDTESTQVSQFQQGGFQTQNLSDGVSLSEMQSRGWVDANGIAHTKFAIVGDQPNVSADISGVWNPNATYSYTWSGDENLTGSGASLQKSYQTTGIKQATVTVSSSDGTAIGQCSIEIGQVTTCPSGQVQIGDQCWILDFGNEGTNNNNAPGATNWPCTGTEYCTCLK